MSVDFQIEWHKSVSSTNDVCQHYANKGAAEGIVVAADFQEQGRGQRGNVWESQEGRNLTFSVLLRPTFLPVAEQFYLSKAISLAVSDWLIAYVPNKPVKIKWPNDIYIGDSKVCGILIENSFSSQYLESSVVGVGINLNQVSFPDDLPNPTSLLLETGTRIDPHKALAELVNCIDGRYLQLAEGYRENIDNEYFNAIYRKNQLCRYYSNGEEFYAKIIGIQPTGELVLGTAEGAIRIFAFKEVTFII